MALQLELTGLERLGRHQALRNLRREGLRIYVHPWGPELGAHRLHDLGKRDRPRVRESFQHRAKPEEVIAVPMGDVDRDEVLPARRDPVRQDPRLLGRQERVDQDGVALTRDQGRGVRHPLQLLQARRQIARESATLDREHLPAQESSGLGHGTLLVIRLSSDAACMGRASGKRRGCVSARGRRPLAKNVPPWPDRRQVLALPSRLGARRRASGDAGLRPTRRPVTIRPPANSSRGCPLRIPDLPSRAPVSRRRYASLINAPMNVAARPAAQAMTINERERHNFISRER